MNDMEPSHLNSYIYKILEFIKKDNKLYSFKEIQDSLGINVLSNSMLIKSLRNNSKVRIENYTIQFVPLFNYRTAEEFIELLKSKVGEEGIEMEKLADAPVDIKQFLLKYVESNEIYILKDMDGSEVVFYNDSNIVPIDDKIKALWNSVKILNYHNIIDELNLAGLKKDLGSDAKKKLVSTIKKKKRSQRRIKITNTHVKGLNLEGMNDEYDN